ncbi:uncharacterized protein PHALS_09603 [Plasmopara halstedii]|uniref:Uncharacterized protein n=1 Tax=Plasmopara halstedii TaxID=4781 RepID=A0A0P1AEZ9_PLAHL|nr:uncharacterized protein PHALS_09603 [Plasmopara halstedii]CEG39351.1 hypothetical protein PHALS_09603 [Plasmopara halstedii]|eukprot:XP_024575720.1 hypothetical protein PHALS_09603 [Plasmopara halstedii]
MELVEKTTTLSSPLIKREISPDVVDLQSHTNTSPSRTGMTPSCLKSYLTWVPFPLIPSVVPENKVSLFNDRQLDPLEWVDLLEQTECLDYISPDIDKCIERQSRMEGNQELELTGREFVDSPVIPRLPYLSGLSSAEQPTLLMPRTRLQGGHASRCSSLRELPSCRKTLTENNDANLKNTYPVIAEQLIQMKRPSRGAKRSTAHSSLRSANRLLDFETSQHSNSRHKRASWGGRPARVANARAASRRECKSARKSKDCMIPGCTKATKEVASASRMAEENGAPLEDARTQLNLADCAKAMEVERDVGLKDVLKAVKQEDFVVVINLRLLFCDRHFHQRLAKH